MKGLGREARSLLDAAAGANAAPPAIRQRAKKRLVSAMAAGTITTSAVVAKGAWLAARSASLGATPVVAGTSITATLVSAIVIGLSTGLVAVSPASKTEAPRPTIGTQAPAEQPSATARAVTKSVPPMIQRVVPQLTAPTAATAAFPPQEAPEVVEPQRVASPNSVPQPEEPTNVMPATKSSRDVAAPSSPTKASIARETELLAEVQRALKSGQALKALYTLDRHSEEFPSGQLYEEATASRVVALCAVGRLQDGRRWADEFARRYPNSPLSSRVHSACPKVGTQPSNPPSLNE
jgi:hypothetical protein